MHKIKQTWFPKIKIELTFSFSGFGTGSWSSCSLTMTLQRMPVHNSTMALQTQVSSNESYISEALQTVADYYSACYVYQPLS